MMPCSSPLSFDSAIAAALDSGALPALKIISLENIPARATAKADVLSALAKVPSSPVTFC